MVHNRTHYVDEEVDDENGVDVKILIKRRVLLMMIMRRRRRRKTENHDDDSGNDSDGTHITITNDMNINIKFFLSGHQQRWTL